MASQLFPTSNSMPAVRRPVMEVNFGGGGGRLGPASSAVGTGDDTAWSRHVVSLTAEAGLAPAVNVVELVLAQGESAPAIALGDQGSIQAGYEDSDKKTAFTGTVCCVTRMANGRIRITATDGGAMLAQLRVNQSYQQQNAGDVVRDLADQAEVQTGSIENGIDLPFFVVDDRRSALEHVAALARRSGLLAFFAPDGTLQFTTPNSGQPAQTFTFGVDILQLEGREAVPLLDSVTAVGEGAAGSQGSAAWSWLVKDPAVSNTAGGGTLARLVGDGALRSGAAAQSAAASALAAAERTNVRGRLVTAGAPAVTVGSTIEIADAPQESLNGQFLVSHVRHEFSKPRGFITTIDFSKSGEAGGLLGALGGLL